MRDCALKRDCGEFMSYQKRTVMKDSLRSLGFVLFCVGFCWCCFCLFGWLKAHAGHQSVCRRAAAASWSSLCGVLFGADGTEQRELGRR